MIKDVFKNFLPLIFFASISFAQETNNFDKDFLESLPDEVRSDIEKEMNSKIQKEKDKVFKQPSSKLQKLKTVQQWLEFQREYEIKESDRFGIDIFRTMQSTFSPINEPNFDPNYILDYGDLLEIQLINDDSESYEVPVQRDGSINIPDIGKINVSGLELKNAAQNIQKLISEVFVGTNTIVTLLEVRDIQVLVTGNASFPGIYTMSGNSNILSALSVAGGVNDIGSLRNIEIKRNNKVIKVIDFYDTIIYGNSAFETRLRSGDVVLIKPLEKLVRIEGGVNVPHLYELKRDETFEDLVNHAQGYSPLSNKDVLYILSISSNDVQEVFQIDNLNSSVPKHLDSIYVPFIKKETIKIIGEVERPGDYEISKDYTLSSVIAKAGGYTKLAYPFGGQIFKQRIKEQEEEMLSKMYTELVEFLASAGNAPQSGVSVSSSMNLSFILQELKQVEPVGRFYSEFDLTKISSNPDLDTFLEDGDVISIPKFEPTVYVYGEVMMPGTQRYEPGKKIDFYVNKSGGLSRFADSGYIYVVAPDGTAQKISSNVIFKKDVLIYPGSTIYVSRQVGKFEGVAYASIIAPIFSSLALTLASISSINN